MFQRFAPSLVRRRTSRRIRRWPWALAWALPPAFALAALVLTEPAPARAIKDIAFDSFLAWNRRAYDPAAPVRVADIDEESLRRIGQWPWPRTTLAALIAKLGDAGASVIALDILIAEPDRSSLEQVIAAMAPSPARDELSRLWRDGGVANDAALAATIAKYPVVASFVGADPGAGPARTKAGFAWQGDPAIGFLRPAFPGAILPLPPIEEAASGLGAINITPDRDLIVRRVPTLVRIGEAMAPGLAMEALRVAQQASTFLVKSSNASGAEGFGAQTGIVSLRNGDVVVDTDADGSVRVHYAGSQPERRISAWTILAGAFDPERVRGRIVLVGSSAAALSDVRATPLEQAVAGVDIHAELLEHIASGASIVRPDYGRGAEAFAIVVAGAAAGFISVALSPLAGAAAALALAAALVFGAWLLFTQGGLLFDPVLPPLAVFASFAMATVAAWRRTERDRAQIRDAFGRYVSPAVIASLVADPSKLTLGGELRPVTVMFSDIRNFTQRSESLEATEVVRFLNAVHTPLSDAVLNFGGTVDKYIGDGMMAFWNAPLDDSDHVRQALRAALAMIDSLPEIAGQMLAGAPAGATTRLAIGIGVHTGIACVGNLGSSRRFDYSIVGDTVNTAARIEPMCKEYGAPIILSQAVVEAAPDFAAVEIDSVALRGRQAATRLHALLGDEAFARGAEFSALRNLHAEALAAWRANAPDLSDKIAACEASPAARSIQSVYRYWREKRTEVSAPGA